MNASWIEGVHINLDHEVFKVKTLKELKEKSGLFTSIPEDKVDGAFETLWKELHPGKPNKEAEKTE